MAREVVDPGGVRWRIRRRWLPERLRRPRLRGDVVDVPDLGGLDDPSGVLAIVALAIVAIFVAFVVVPLLLLLGEVVLFVAVVLVVVAGQFAWLAPWTLEAQADGRRLRWRVKGWRASRRALGDIAAALERGQRPPPDLLPATGPMD